MTREQQDKWDNWSIAIGVVLMVGAILWRVFGGEA